jgi:predicted nucleic acid-binding protein
MITEYNFIDTNILIYSTFPEEFKEKHIISNKILSDFDNLVISNQIILEYINVSTNNKIFEYPLSTEKALSNIDKYLKIVKLVTNHNIEYSILKEASLEYGIENRKVFDLNIYLIMKINNISNLITFNKNDFEMFKDIKILDIENIKI